MSRAVPAPWLCRSAASRGPRAASAVFFSLYNQDEAPGFGPGTCFAPFCQSSGLRLIPTLGHWCQVKLLKPSSWPLLLKRGSRTTMMSSRRGRTSTESLFFFLDNVWFGGLERWFQLLNDVKGWVHNQKTKTKKKVCFYIASLCINLSCYLEQYIPNR